MLLSPLTSKALLAGGIVLAAAEAPAATSDRGSLYFAISGLLGSAFASFALIYQSRSKRADPAPTPYVVDDGLTDELTGLYADAERRAAQHQMAAEMWKARAISKGWPEDQE